MMSAPTQSRPCENFQPVISAICVLYYTHKGQLGCRMDLFRIARKSTKAEYLKNLGKLADSQILEKSGQHYYNLPASKPLRPGRINHRPSSYYSLGMQSIMLIFSPQLCDLLPLLSSPWFNSSPPLSATKYSINRQCVVVPRRLYFPALQ